MLTMGVANGGRACRRGNSRRVAVRGSSTCDFVRTPTTLIRAGPVSPVTTNCESPDWRAALHLISYPGSVNDSKIDLQAAADACSCPGSHGYARNAHKAPL